MSPAVSMSYFFKNYCVAVMYLYTAVPVFVFVLLSQL